MCLNSRICSNGFFLQFLLFYSYIFVQEQDNEDDDFEEVDDQKTLETDCVAQDPVLEVEKLSPIGPHHDKLTLDRLKKALIFRLCVPVPKTLAELSKLVCAEYVRYCL